MTALLWASYNGHVPVVRELVTIYKVDILQTDKVNLISFTTLCHGEPHTRTNYFVLDVHTMQYGNR